jgi:NAD(P)-dependent dehydrogenase (short-subunit alcohol dehydrogenase family)
VVELGGQVAIITGGGRGIGRAVAEALARAGAKVGIVSRSTGELEETAEAIRRSGGEAYCFTANVTHPDEIARAAAETRRKLGPVTLLVNNAGTPGPVGTDWEVDAGAWWECIDVSLRGAFLCNQAVLPAMIEAGMGRIILMASTSGTRAVPPATATSIAKTALIRMAEGLALQAAPHGVSVFAIHPGVVDTKLLQSYGFGRPATGYAPPERAGDLCVRLASGAYDALSGRFLTIDDDLDALVGEADELIARQLHTLRVAT